MKKSLYILLTLLTLLFCQSASATINEDEVALGGLMIRTDISNAYNIYGSPDRIADGFRYFWGNGFEVWTKNEYECEINYIVTTANNGIATPSGIHVGSNVDDLYKIYGIPDFSNVALESADYEYHYTGVWNKLIFTAANNKITKITALKNIR